MKPVSWRVYYPDGAVDSSQAAWEAAPAAGVQVVVVFYDESYRTWDAAAYEWRTEPYRRLLQGWDYYWRGADGNFGAANDPAEIPAGLPDGAVKRGLPLPDAEWRAAYARAWADMERPA